MSERGPEKPAFGMPCNGCGLCCAMEVCTVGRKIFKTDVAPCPGMRWREGRFNCLLVEMADEMSPTESLVFRLKMGIGIGCDSEIDDEQASR